jgi:hypothetical protein
MAEEKSKLKFFIYSILILLLFFGLIRIIIGSGGKFFGLELVGFFVLLILSLVGLIGYARAWGERVLFFVFLFYILNLVLVWYFTDLFYITLLIISMFGFLFSIPQKCSCCCKQCPSKPTEEPHSEIFEPATKVTKPSTKTVSSHKPGKYAASNSSNNYHEPKCEWAKRIKKERLIWFKSKEEAWDKGYKAHSCVN